MLSAERHPFIIPRYHRDPSSNDRHVYAWCGENVMYVQLLEHRVGFAVWLFPKTTSVHFARGTCRLLFIL